MSRVFITGSSDGLGRMAAQLLNGLRLWEFILPLPALQGRSAS
jgi:hypothetical protein